MGQQRGCRLRVDTFVPEKLGMQLLGNPGVSRGGEHRPVDSTGRTTRQHFQVFCKKKNAQWIPWLLDKPLNVPSSISQTKKGTHLCSGKSLSYIHDCCLSSCLTHYTWLKNVLCFVVILCCDSHLVLVSAAGYFRELIILGFFKEKKISHVLRESRLRREGFEFILC